MATYRTALPQLSSVSPFMADGGIETTLIFRMGIDLPEFAAFVLLDSDSGEETLRDYYGSYARLARQYRMGLVLDSATWRANQDWGAKLGLAPTRLAEINRQSIALLEEVRSANETDSSPMVISGSIGPRGDGYFPTSAMTATQARDYHREQIEIFTGTQADMVTAFTMNYVEEALGITLAAQALDMPAVLSFTVETNGMLPSGQTLQEAIEQVDAQSGAYPLYYMINCAHPTHFLPALPAQASWLARLGGVRANASMKSHAELDQATELDEGNPEELARQYRDVANHVPKLRVVGGCCGTDERHIEELCKVFAPIAE